MNENSTANKIYSAISKTFFFFMDTSGSFLGAFLILLGIWILGGNPVPIWLGLIVFVLGIASFLTHFTHYVISRRHGSDYFYTTRKKS